VLVLVGAAVAASRHLDDEIVARRIDRASSLSDRLSTAIAFHRSVVSGARADGDDRDGVTAELMLAAIDDGVRAVPRANIAAAAPYAVPRDGRAALGFMAIAAVAAGLSLPLPDRAPHVFSVEPAAALPGSEVMIKGEHLLEGVAAPVASVANLDRAVLGAAQPQALSKHRGYVPGDAKVMLGIGDKARPVTVLDWKASEIWIQIPDDAAVGTTFLTAILGDKELRPLPFEVLDKHDANNFRDKALILEEDERALIEAKLAFLKQVAQTDKVEDLDKFNKVMDQILSDVREGKVTKEQALEQMQKAADEFNKNTEADPKDIQKQMAEMGKDLAKDKLTKDLGDALQKNDLDKAKKEMEKLADKLENHELTEQQKEELGKQLDKVSKDLEKQDKDKQDKQQQQQNKMEEEIRRLEKDKKEAKTDKERLDRERRLEQKKDELKKLQKDQQDKQNSEQRQALKRLQRDMEKAAENLQKPQKQDGQQKDERDENEKERDRQASQKMRDAARETGKVDQDQRKQAAQKKVASQMEELREAMRRAKQKGNKGPQDPFNRQGKNQDLAQRAKGGKGNKDAWKQGQGQGQGQGKGKGQGQGQGQGQGGQGQDPGGKEWGTGHDDNLTADATSKSGNDKDADLTGKVSDKGTSTREAILAAAQKGFARQSYKNVYAKYESVIEDVMRNEKVPSSYKHFVERYFTAIRPRMDAGKTDKSDNTDTKATP